MLLKYWISVSCSRQSELMTVGKRGHQMNGIKASFWPMWITWWSYAWLAISCCGRCEWKWMMWALSHFLCVIGSKTSTALFLFWVFERLTYAHSGHEYDVMPQEIIQLINTFHVECLFTRGTRALQTAKEESGARNLHNNERNNTCKINVVSSVFSPLATNPEIRSAQRALST